MARLWWLLLIPGPHIVCGRSVESFVHWTKDSTSPNDSEKYACCYGGADDARYIRPHGVHQ